MSAKHHVNLKVVEEFLRRKIYPKEIAKDKGKKANFRRTCKNFLIKDEELFYKKSRKVIFWPCTKKSSKTFPGKKICHLPNEFVTYPRRR